jgi:D-aminopeptidase
MTTYQSTLPLVSLIIAGLAAPFESQAANRKRARELGAQVGSAPTGKWNAITDVPGVKVGHATIHEGKDIHTGVTVILPHGDNIFQEKVPAAVWVGNGFGKLAGSTQIRELGNIETPIALTSTLSIGLAMNAIVHQTLVTPGNEDVRSVNAVVGETNDGYLNDIREFRVDGKHVSAAIRAAKSGPVLEGSVGAGSGTRCFGFKGGIGTSSRVVKTASGDEFTLGVLVQSNFGGKLRVNGAPFGATDTARRAALKQVEGNGSCMIVIATDAPLSPRNLERTARRALHGMARTGASMSNGSGDYVIAFSTAWRIPYRADGPVKIPPLINNDHMTPFFGSAMDATQEAIYNSMFMATTVEGMHGTAEAIDLEAVTESLKKHKLLKEETR